MWVCYRTGTVLRPSLMRGPGCFAKIHRQHGRGDPHFDAAEKNRLCPPCLFGNSLAQWAEMNVRGTRAAMAFGGEADIAGRANGVAVNPARISADHPGSPVLGSVRERLAASRFPASPRSSG